MTVYDDALALKMTVGKTTWNNDTIAYCLISRSRFCMYSSLFGCYLCVNILIMNDISSVRMAHERA